MGAPNSHPSILARISYPKKISELARTHSMFLEPYWARHYSLLTFLLSLQLFLLLLRLLFLHQHLKWFYSSPEWPHPGPQAPLPLHPPSLAHTSVKIMETQDFPSRCFMKHPNQHTTLMEPITSLSS
jgi:hypothetical protein